jgi:hypothetical protein
MDVRVDAPIESSSLDAASGGAIPTRARHALSGAVMSVVSRLTGVQPSVQRQRIITVRPANFPKPRNTLAFSAGIPVIATRLGGHVELLAQGGWVLYEPDTQGELDYALERLTTRARANLVEEQPRVATMAEHATEIAEIFRSIANETEYR